MRCLLASIASVALIACSESASCPVDDNSDSGAPAYEAIILVHNGFSHLRILDPTFTGAQTVACPPPNETAEGLSCILTFQSPGTQTLTVSAPGFVSQQLSFSLAPDQRVQAPCGDYWTTSTFETHVELSPAQ